MNKKLQGEDKEEQGVAIFNDTYGRTDLNISDFVDREETTKKRNLYWRFIQAAK